jgi:hypothetical protein
VKNGTIEGWSNRINDHDQSPTDLHVGSRLDPECELIRGPSFPSAANARRSRQTQASPAEAGTASHERGPGRAGPKGASPGDLAGRRDARRRLHRSVGLLTRPALGRETNHTRRRAAGFKLCDVTKGALVWTSAEGDLGHVQSLVFSPDGRSLYCCDSSAITRVDASTGQTRKDLMRATDERSE